MSPQSTLRTVRRATLALLSALLVSLVATSTSGGADTGAITGKVTALSGGAPIEGVEVCANRTNTVPTQKCALSEADGTYSLTGLLASEYVVVFSTGPDGPNVVRRLFDNTENYVEADYVIVGEGETVENVDAQMREGGAIKGTVTGLGGAPVEGTNVCAVTEETFADCGESDDKGEYAITGVPPGEWMVRFGPTFLGPEYLTQYYDHRDRESEADPVAIAAGEVKAGIDAELEVGAAIEGTVFSPTGATPSGISVCALEAPGGKLVHCTETVDGRYRLRLLPAGDYKVTFSPEFQEFFPWFADGPDDGYSTRFYDEKASAAAADVVSLTPPDVIAGIDAHLVASPAPTPFSTIIVPLPLGEFSPEALPQAPLHCPKGFKRQMVKGKLRCVKRHKRRHHRGVRRGRAPASVPFRVR